MVRDFKSGDNLEKKFRNNKLLGNIAGLSRFSFECLNTFELVHTYVHSSSYYVEARNF